MKIIGIAGRINSGKDFAGAELARVLNEAGYVTEVSSFAAPIRKMAERIGFNLSRERKEVPVTFDRDVFDERLCNALDTFLSTYGLSLDVGAHLWAYMQDALESYVEEDCYYISARQFMQLMGTEAGRRVHPQLWNRLAIQERPVDFLILTDVRFEEEEETCDILLHIESPHSIYNEHASESAQAYLRAVAEFPLYNDHGPDFELELEELAETIIKLYQE